MFVCSKCGETMTNVKNHECSFGLDQWIALSERMERKQQENIKAINCLTKAISCNIKSIKTLTKRIKEGQSREIELTTRMIRVETAIKNACRRQIN